MPVLVIGAEREGKVCRLRAVLALFTEDRREKVATEIRRHVPTRFVLGEGLQFRSFEPSHQVVVGSPVACGQARVRALPGRALLHALHNIEECLPESVIALDLVNVCQDASSFNDLALPGRCGIDVAADTAAKGRHVANGFADSAPCARDRNAGARHLVGKVRPDANDDDSMAALWHTEGLGTHDEVGRLFGLQQRRLAVRKTDRPEFIVVCVPSAERSQILHQHLKNHAAFDCR